MLSNSIRSHAELAQMVARIAGTTQPDVIICVTESGVFVQHLLKFLIKSKTGNQCEKSY